MLEQLKSLMGHQVRGAPPEFVFSLTPDTRSAILLDLRYVLRDAARARTLPLLQMLVNTVERNHARIRFPAEVLMKLAREVEQIRDKLPVKSPLLALADGAREHLGGVPLVGDGPPTLQPAPPEELPARSHKPGAPREGREARLAAPAEVQPVGDPMTKTGPTSLFQPDEALHAIRRDAARNKEEFVTTLALDDIALFGYLSYCMNLGDYARIVETLLARVESQPRVWAWNMLVTAMRLSGHRDFSFTAARFHVWLAATHPETIADSKDDDQRKFSADKIAALERKELGQG